MANYFDINGFVLNDQCNPYIIAEIGVNHGGNIDLAKKLIDQAKSGGANAVKFQSYKADKIASKHSPAYWDTNKENTDSQYKLFQKYDSFNAQDYVDLADYCAQKNIDFSSTPFDLDAVDFLEPLVPFFKIASADITNIPLLRRVGQSGKPIILSTGASSLPEIVNAVEILKQSGCNKIALLHCILNYPTPITHAQLSGVRTLQRAFPDLVIGYSDHVVPDETISALEVATLFGCAILEKHFTYDKSLPGNDHYHAMNESDLRRFVEKITLYRSLIGNGSKDLALEEKARLHARRSIFTNGRIEKGQKISEQMLIAKRPGHGISPLHWDQIIGKTAVEAMDDDEMLLWSKLS